jgi:hypothetical protein
MKILTTALLLALLTSVCLSEEMPVGWAKPPAKLTGQEFRRKDPNHFLIVTGDFNGDGVQDKALLRVNQQTQKLGFFICLTTATGCDWHRLEVMDIAFLDVMGIGKVKPGQYETACGKGYWDCRKDEPTTLSTKRDAVEFFKDESASSVYVYNSGKISRRSGNSISDWAWVSPARPTT